MREVLWEFVNQGDLDFIEGDWSKMREPPLNGRALATTDFKN